MRLIVIPEDKTIIKDGSALVFDFPCDSNIHAIQWYGDHGTIERKISGGVPADLADVQPFADAWDAERARIDAIPAPAPATPTSVTMRQARLALLQSGLLSAVNTAVAAADEATKIEWEFSNTVERDRPLVATLAGALGLTSQQLDDLFTLAATL